MLEKVENLPKGKDIGDAFRERQVAMAVACVFAAKRLSVSFNSTKKWHTVFQNLILRPEAGKRECFELSVVTKYFPEKRYLLLRSA